MANFSGLTIFEFINHYNVTFFSANQWTGFYVIRASVMKELNGLGIYKTEQLLRLITVEELRVSVPQKSYSQKLEKFIGKHLCWSLFLLKLQAVGLYRNHYRLNKSIGWFNMIAKFLANIYLLKVNNRNIRRRCEICSKLITKTPERRQWHDCGVFIVNFEHISHLFPSVSVVDFEQVNVSWDWTLMD